MPNREVRNVLNFLHVIGLDILVGRLGTHVRSLG